MSTTLDNLRKIATASNAITAVVEEKPLPEPKKKKKKTSSLSFLYEEDEEVRRRKRHEHNSEVTMQELSAKLDSMRTLDSSDFDALLDTISDEDDDIELRGALVGMGRKYARSNAASEGESEIDKAFAPYEQEIKQVLVEMRKDAANIAEDLDMLRGNKYGQNPIKTAELQENRTALHDGRLRAIKQLSDITKTKFELKTKLTKDNSGDSSVVTSNIMQSIFGMGHNTIVGDVGGREEFSGGYVEDEDSNENGIAIEETLIDEFESDDDEMSDGDLYLKYEGKKIDLVLEVDTETGERRVWAEDEEHNVIPDYPLPDDIDTLELEINERAGTAVDNLQNNYIYRER